jgi:hypothetical protein
MPHLMVRQFTDLLIQDEKDGPMIRTILSTAVIATVLMTNTATTQANDIVNFLRAMQGGSRHHDRHDHDRHRFDRHDHDRHDHDRHRAESFRDAYRVARHSDRHSHDHHYYDVGRRSVNLGRRNSTSLSFHIGTSYPSRSVYAPPVAIAPPPVAIAPAPVYELGQIVTCSVPLEPHVNVHNAHEIAPRAVPTIVAVRNPHLGRFGSPGCVESLVYVQVFAPSCPPDRVSISPCHTKVKLTWGRYDVEVVSCNDHVDVEYDD